MLVYIIDLFTCVMLVGLTLANKGNLLTYVDYARNYFAHLTRI